MSFWVMVVLEALNALFFGAIVWWAVRDYRRHPDFWRRPAIPHDHEVIRALARDLLTRCSICGRHHGTAHRQPGWWE